MAEARCPKCSGAVRRGQASCPHCQEAFPKGAEPCPHCKFVVPFDARTCPSCGRGMSGRALTESAPISADEERRLVASARGSQPDTKKCPYCAEDIKWEANVCRYCHRDLVGPGAGTVATNAPAQSQWNPGIAALLSLIIPGVGQMYKGQVLNGLVWFFFVIFGYFLFIFPGLILHLCCIAGAAMGNREKAQRSIGGPAAT